MILKIKKNQSKYWQFSSYNVFIYSGKLLLLPVCVLVLGLASFVFGKYLLKIIFETIEVFVYKL